jgi:Immunity protein 50
MNWHMHSVNPKAIEHLYTAVPCLDKVSVTEIKLGWDGPSLSLHALLPDFPDTPPPRWVHERYNAVALQLDFWGITNLHINGWSTQNSATIDVARLDATRLRVSMHSADFTADATCAYFRIAHVTGYTRDTNQPQ